MKKLFFSVLTSLSLLSINTNAESMYERFQAMQNEVELLKEEVATLKKQKNIKLIKRDDQENISKAEMNDEADEDDIEDTLDYFDKKISTLNKATNGNHLKFSADYRFSLDNINYTMADNSEAKNDAFMSNRFWLNMFYKANNNLSMIAQVAYNKAFGSRSGTTSSTDTAYSAYEQFDWITNENAYDGMLRLKNAYFFYKNDTFASLDIPWTFSIGRRPSTNGHLVNFRENDKSSSPMAHTVNVEFDGLSSKFVLNKKLGTYLKFCAGRGMTNADVKFTSTPYAETDDIPQIDLLGLIFVPLNNGQYSINTQYYYANNLIDMNDANKSSGFDTVGGLHSFTANFILHGIGSDLGEFLDDTILFVSGAYTKTDPKDGKRMLYGAVDLSGATQAGESKTGYSYWIGTQFPSLISKDGRWGVEYNHGSQYFRSITYGEDTNIGSKVATRGNAYEAYMTEYLVEKYLSLQLRYTYVDYEYTGSNGFFGETTGASYSIADAVNFGMGSQVVETAQDIRFYIRYRY